MTERNTVSIRGWLGMWNKAATLMIVIVDEKSCP